MPHLTPATVGTKDRVERAARSWFSTMLSAGLSLYVGSNFPIEWWGKAAIIATGTAIGSFVLSYTAKFFGEPGTASFVKGVEYKGPQ